MFIFIPLAHRLGLYSIKSEMEDIWLRYKEPQAFNEIQAKINRNVSDKEKQVDEFIGTIRKLLDRMNINYEIRKRVKSPYSSAIIYMWRLPISTTTRQTVSATG